MYIATLKYEILKEYEDVKAIKSRLIIQDVHLLHDYFFSLSHLSLTKTLLYPTKDSCAPHRDLHCKEDARKKERDGQKEGRSAGDSLPVLPPFFEAVSYLLHPGHEYELGPSRSGIGTRPISSMLAPWATVSCCSGSSHCSALCNYTVYNPPPLYSFFESVTPLPSPPVCSVSRRCLLLCSMCVSSAVVPPGAKVALDHSRLRVSPSPFSSNSRLISSTDLLTRFSTINCI